MASIPEFKEFLISENDTRLIKIVKNLAYKSAYELLKVINKKEKNNKSLQICTSESLTAGLIMATLVDIPWMGYAKYGCFGVYQTDAKRVFNGVKVSDVYTHKCASEMAIGILKNSNATIGIAVTGNAMQANSDVDKLGEVFISISGYKNNKMIYITKVINACVEDPQINGKCSTWHKIIKIQNKFNKRNDTATINNLLRNYTTHSALKLCAQFIEKFDPEVPDFVTQRINTNLNTELIPANKYKSLYENGQNQDQDQDQPSCKNKDMGLMMPCDTSGIRIDYPNTYLYKGVSTGLC